MGIRCRNAQLFGSDLWVFHDGGVLMERLCGGV